jgi:hypothetical protein
MPKFRDIPTKYKILVYLFSLKKKRNRVLDLPDVEEMSDTQLRLLYKHDTLWDCIDKYIGKPLTEHGECEIWTKISEAFLV